jgi:Ala-tRNA(Pro) deacylase
MTIAPRTRLFLETGRTLYSLVPRSALAPAEFVAKAVLLRDDQGYLLAVLPASQRLSVERVRDDLARKLEPASERELAAIFSDCALAATPPFGAAYGIPTVVDEALLHLGEVYFEVGHDESLARVRGADFAALFANSIRGSYAVPTAGPEGGSNTLHEKAARERRLVEGLTHVFSLRSFGAGLRSDAEYERNGHAGMLLLKAPELRIVLEAMRAGTVLRTHFVHGPTTLLVLDGALDVTTEHGAFRVAESEMATLPREERREIRAAADSLFLLALGRLAHADEVTAPAPSGASAAAAVGAVTRGAIQRPRRVLVVANRTAGGAHLVAAVRERIAAGPCEFVVLAPAVEAHAETRWTWEEGAARGEAQRRVEAAVEQLERLGAPVRGTVGDFYPLRAIQDLLLVEEEGFDEIILSTFPAPVSEWLKLDLPARIARRFGIAVTHVAAEE